MPLIWFTPVGAKSQSTSSAAMKTVRVTPGAGVDAELLLLPQPDSTARKRNNKRLMLNLPDINGTSWWMIRICGPVLHKIGNNSETLLTQIMPDVMTGV